MNFQLPDAVSLYFDISNGGAPSRLRGCFCANATVIDEKITHQGWEAIETWQREAQRAFTYRIEPLQAVQEADRLIVTTRVVGNFPGSPVDLAHAFTLKDDRIHSLEITP